MNRATKCLVVASLVVVGLWITATPAEASHFRFGHITWKARPDLGPTAAEFKVKTAWRRSFTSGTAPDGRVAVGDLFPLIGAQFTLAWGDGSFQSSAPSTVLSIDPASDWFLAETAGLIHTYPAMNNGGIPWLVRIDGCCRIYSPQRNAPGTSYTVQTTVNLGIAGGDSSPESTAFPIVNMAASALNVITIPVAEPDGDTFNCRLATSGESFIANEPGPPTPGPTSALSVSTTAGGCRLTWQTNGTALGELWATSVVIEQSRGGNPAHGRVGLEFLIRIVGVVGQPPVCNVPPTPTGTTQIGVGQMFNATIQGSDPDPGETLSLNSSGIPAGSTLTPSLPIFGGSPISAVLSWTPTAGDLGPHPFLFSITDTSGQQALCSFTLDVVQSFNPFGGIVRTPTRTVRGSIRKPTPDTTGVRCVETLDPNNPDFDSLPFMPFTSDPLEFDFKLSAGDGTKTVCCEFINNMSVISAPQCTEITLEEPCPPTPAPLSQGYWHRQCLGTGEIDPGRNGRGPTSPTEPDFVSDDEPCADRTLENQGIYGVTTCEGMDASPPSDPCERAIKQLTGVILNVCSSRVANACDVDVSALGCSSVKVGDLITEISSLIQSGDCVTAEGCAAAINEGTGLPALASPVGTDPPAGGTAPPVVGTVSPVTGKAPTPYSFKDRTGNNSSLKRQPKSGRKALLIGAVSPSNGADKGRVVGTNGTPAAKPNVGAGRIVVDAKKRTDIRHSSATTLGTEENLRQIHRDLKTIADRSATEAARKASMEALLAALGGGYEPAVRLRIVRTLASRGDAGLQSLLSGHLEGIVREARESGQPEIANQADQLLAALRSSR